MYTVKRLFCYFTAADSFNKESEPRAILVDLSTEKVAAMSPGQIRQRIVSLVMPRRTTRVVFIGKDQEHVQSAMNAFRNAQPFQNDWLNLLEPSRPAVVMSEEPAPFADLPTPEEEIA